MDIYPGSYFFKDGEDEARQAFSFDNMMGVGSNDGRAFNVHRTLSGFSPYANITVNHIIYSDEITEKDYSELERIKESLFS